jgi:hypothetical protein
MIEFIFWVITAFVLWNLLSVAFVYSRRWVDRTKHTEDIINCKWRKDG